MVSRMGKRALKTAGCFAAVLFLEFFISLTGEMNPFSVAGSFITGGLIIAWGQIIRGRLTHRHIRNCMVGISLALAGLFFIRLGRYKFFEYSVTAQRYLWYLYYLPFIIVPLLSYRASAMVGSGENDPLPKHIKALRLTAVLLILMTLTNDIHSQVLLIRSDGSYVHKTGYYFILAWTVLLTAASYRMLIKRSSAALMKKRLYIPLLFSGAGAALQIWYAVNGGSPELFGHKLIYVQETYSLIYIGMWEGCMMIGLLPANMGYSKLFEICHINGQITDKNGIVRYASRKAAESGRELMFREKDITGGTFSWTEDVSALHRLNLELEIARGSINEENDLIEEENRTAAERTAYETRNRLYDSIAAHSHSQLKRIADTLQSKELFQNNIKQDLLLGTYVKRCANLMLIADGTGCVSTEELALSVRESLENLSLFGIDCELVCGESMGFPDDIVINAYDLFEAAAESVCETCSAFSVRINKDNELMRIDTDGIPDEERLYAAVSGTGLAVSIVYEDGIAVIRSEAKQYER